MSSPPPGEPKAPKPSVLVVTPFFPPWGGGGVMRMTKLVKYLPDLGWRVTVVCSDERVPEVLDESLLEEIPDSVRVIRVKGPFRSVGGAATGAVRATGRRRMLEPVIRFAKLLARALLIPDRWVGWSLKVRRLSVDVVGTHDVVLSSGPPHSVHLAGEGLARRLGVPLVVDLRDEWGNNPLHRHPAPWHGPMDRRLERRILRGAARVISVFDSLKATLDRRYPWVIDRSVSIPNGYDPADFDGLPARALAAPGEAVRFLYAGSLRGTQDVGAFFRVFGRLAADQSRPLSLQLLGFISPHHLTWATAAVPPGVLTIREPVSHRNAIGEMANAHVLVVFTGEGGGGRDTLTGKLFEYLATRRPILLVGPPGSAGNLVRATSAGAVADPADPAALEAAILEAISMAADPSFTGAPAEALERFDRRHEAGAFDQLLRSVLPTPRPPSQGIG